MKKTDNWQVAITNCHNSLKYTIGIELKFNKKQSNEKAIYFIGLPTESAKENLHIRFNKKKVVIII